MKKEKHIDDMHYPYPDCPEPRTCHIPGDPASAWDMVNKYGTYNIQPTSDADHQYPSIHQGLPTQWKNLRQSKTELFPDYVQKNK